ncbi:MAG TPA: aldolase [Candidatus Sulfotelmatobacter sp.]|nr:aldolase [Candidatus Sulfotelmatobacter sp.]
MIPLSETLRERESSDGSPLPLPISEGCAYDPLLSLCELPLKKVFYPRGFPVAVHTNSEEVLEAAHESWGENRQAFDVPEIRIDVGVLPAFASHCFNLPVCRSRENILCSIADAQNFSVCDVGTGYAFCWLSRHTVNNHAYFRYHFLEAAALSLVTTKYLTPVHGACVAWKGKGILLCGDSGAGKSSLSFACARRGWTFLSDDATCLVRGRKGRIVVGNPEHIHFRESAFEIFPELRHIPLRPRINGEIAVELATESCSEIKTAHEAEVDFVLFLNRQPSVLPSVLPFSRATALANLSQILCYGEEKIRKEQKRSLANLVSAEVLEFRYSDLEPAVAFLRRLAESEA